MTDTTVFGSALADAIKLASSAVDKIYHGANAVWPHDYDIEYLIVAGGGGGAGNLGSSRSGGAGGAGGMLEATGVTLEPGHAYTIIVGAGGNGGSIHGNKGGNSSFGPIARATGGGRGTRGLTTGGAGGSGGGAGGPSSLFGAATNGGAGIQGQGRNGGSSSLGAHGGAGGGKSAVGEDGHMTASQNRTGGAGKANSISGSRVTYSRGGYRRSNDVAGRANTGNGGDTKAHSSTSTGKRGGSGIVIIRYAGAQKGTGGTVTSSGGNTIHTFKHSGTFTA